MRNTFLLTLALAAGCRPGPDPDVRGLLSASLCACPCAADAAVDAPPDAPADAPPDAPVPLPIDPLVAWTRTVIVPGAPVGVFRGADGVALDAEGCITTAWEEGGIVTRACPSGANWETELVTSGFPGLEDAKSADLGRGVIDTVAASDAGSRVILTCRGTPNVTTTIAASLGHGRAMQVAIGDISGDGLPDIVFGTRLGTPAVIAELRNPGAAELCDGAAWTYHPISAAGWAMGLALRDLNADGRIDVVVSDRANYKDAAGVTRWDLYGARWQEQTPTGWITHAIGRPAGGCSPYASPTCTKTPGDEMMLHVVDSDTVVDCQSTGSQADSRVVIHRLAAGTHEVLPPVPNVGHCQHALAFDPDGDDDMDIAVSTWKGNAFPVPTADALKSGVYLMRNNGDGTWTRGEISGPEGGKCDNMAPVGRCLLTTEQLDPAGGLGVVEYCPPLPSSAVP